VSLSRPDPYGRVWRLAWLSSRWETLAALEESVQNGGLMMPVAAVDPALRRCGTSGAFGGVLGIGLYVGWGGEFVSIQRTAP
jgi:hypothetical protein